MAIIQTPVSMPATVAAAQAKLAIVGTGNLLFNQLVAAATRLWTMVWEPTTYSTAQILAAFGTDAASTFVLHAQLVTLIETVKPGTLADKYKAVGAPVTVNSDGTVVLTGA